jgi:alpha-aminoadipic semialdehyde synthase
MRPSLYQPIALGALLYLDGKIAQRGLVAPTSEEVWRPMLGALEDAGIRFIEGHRIGSRGILDTLRKQV